MSGKKFSLTDDNLSLCFADERLSARFLRMRKISRIVCIVLFVLCMISAFPLVFLQGDESPTTATTVGTFCFLCFLALILLTSLLYYVVQFTLLKRSAATLPRSEEGKLRREMIGIFLKRTVVGLCELAVVAAVLLIWIFFDEKALPIPPIVFYILLGAVYVFDLILTLRLDLRKEKIAKAIVNCAKDPYDNSDLYR